jgi:hypothetical protein
MTTSTTPTTSTSSDTQLRIRVSKALHDQLRYWADHEGQSVAALCVEALHNHLSQLASGARARDDAVVLALDRLTQAQEKLTDLLTQELESQESEP